MKLAPVALSDQLISRLLDSREANRAFGFLAEANNNLRSTTGCGSCGKQNTVSGNIVHNVRTLIMGLPDTQLNQIKGMLGMPGRPLVAYLGAGKGQRVER